MKELKGDDIMMEIILILSLLSAISGFIMIILGMTIILKIKNILKGIVFYIGFGKKG